MRYTISKEIKLTKREIRIIEVVFDKFLINSHISEKTKEEIKELKYKLL